LGDRILLVASDRISAFDVVLPEGIPGKGKVLNTISKYWFGQTSDIIRNHLISTDVNDYPKEFSGYRGVLEGRSMLVMKTKPLPVECIVRGYIAGSGWKEYRESNSICGIPLPPGLLESSKLEEPIFTPRQGQEGTHDENISFGRAARADRRGLAKGQDVSIGLFEGEGYRGEERDNNRGYKVRIRDRRNDKRSRPRRQALTPDSSDSGPWTAIAQRPQKSFDKQFVRDYLESLDWDKRPRANPYPRRGQENIRKIQRGARASH
jgi:phosphoribosylaminoimidazole-succinocarboxamide synthase